MYYIYEWKILSMFEKCEKKIILIRISQQLKLAESCIWKTYETNRAKCLIRKMFKS